LEDRPNVRSKTLLHCSFQPLLVGCVIVAALLAPSRPAIGQFQQYTPPGSLVERPQGKKDNLENAVEEARWKLGALRVDPWIGVRNLSFVDNVFVGQDEEPASDVTVTVGAGLRGYLRTGPKVIWAAHALPEYIWWQDLEDRRQSTGRYGVGSFAFFNRLTLEATLTRSEGQNIITPEFEQLLTNKVDEGNFSFDLQTGRNFSLFGSASLVEIENLLDDDPRLPRIDRLNREETVVRGGFRLHWREEFSVAIGVESSEVEFDNIDTSLSNSGVSPLLGVSWDRPNFFLEADIVLRDLEAEGDSTFVTYDEPTGSLQLGFNMAADVHYHLYANRSVIYSILSESSYFEGERFGAAITAKLGWRTNVRTFVETGTNRYTFSDPTLPSRSDDVLAVGAGLSFEIARNTAFVLTVTQTDYDSNIDGADRDATFVQAGINLGGGLSPWW